MNKLYGIFLSFNDSLFNCYFWGIRFLDIFSDRPKKLKNLKLFNWLKFSLLQIFMSKYGFIYHFFQNKKDENFFEKTAKSKKQFLRWRVIKKIIKKNYFNFSKINLKKKKLNNLSSSLWEFSGKFFSLLPKNFKISPNYGENLINLVQQNERNLSINIFKTSLFKKSTFITVIKKYNFIYFQNYFQFIPEHINWSLVEEVFSRFFLILIAVFFSKSKEKNYFKIKNISKIIYDLISAQKAYYKIKKLLFSFRHLYNFLPNKYISSNPKIIPDASYKHSWGIFLTYPCNILSLVLEYRGNRIKKSFKNKIEFSNRFRRQNLYFFQINSIVTIDATFLGNEGRLINHGCITNCFTRALKHSNGNFVLIISKKKIGVLEEIFYDYKINIDDTDYDQIQCLCFDVNCKKEMMI